VSVHLTSPRRRCTPARPPPQPIAAAAVCRGQLYAFAQGGCREDNADALNSHELLLVSRFGIY
jgi:hypothetical protein